MKIIKNLLFVVLGIIALFLVAALFIKKDYAVEKEIVINKPKANVFAYVKSLKNQHNFSTWEHKDPNMKMVYTGTDGAVGSTSAWEGNSEVGSGGQKVTKITEGERVDIELHFMKPMESLSPVYFTTEALDSTKTKVKWGMSGHMNYPMNGMQLFMNMDDMIGTEYQKSLNNLKSVLEQHID
jgi:Polyketide cyclase / dehydrase and lipid transport